MENNSNIQEETAVDDSIQSYKRFAYLPISSTNLNNPNPIVIRVENSDNYFRPSDSEIEFEGKVVKEDGSAYKKAEAKLTLINNGIMFLFDNIKYLLSSNIIESVHYPGIASSIMYGFGKIFWWIQSIKTYAMLSARHLQRTFNNNKQWI